MPGSTTSAGCRGCVWAVGTCCPTCSPTRLRWARSRRASSSAPTGSSRSACSPTSTSTTTTSPATPSPRSRAAESTRGEFLLTQQTNFYAAVADSPTQAFDLWDAVRRERNATYMQETREAAEGETGERAQPTSRVVATRESPSRSWPRSPATSRPASSSTCATAGRARAAGRRSGRGAVPGRRSGPTPLPVSPLIGARPRAGPAGQGRRRARHQGRRRGIAMRCRAGHRAAPARRLRHRRARAVRRLPTGAARPLRPPPVASRTASSRPTRAR